MVRLPRFSLKCRLRLHRVCQCSGGAQQARRKRQARWQDKVQLLTLPGQARGLAETVNIAEHGSAAGAANDEEGDVWLENIPVQELAAPQYNAQQVGAPPQSRLLLLVYRASTIKDSAFSRFGVRF